MKFKELYCVLDESEFWFRPEVMNPNHLNLGNILRVFDILKRLFPNWLMIQFSNYVIRCAKTTTLSKI